MAKKSGEQEAAKEVQKTPKEFLREWVSTEAPVRTVEVELPGGGGKVYIRQPTVLVSNTAMMQARDQSTGINYFNYILHIVVRCTYTAPEGGERVFSNADYERLAAKPEGTDPVMEALSKAANELISGSSVEVLKGN